MPDFILRDWAEPDLPGLKALWLSCFDDDEETINDFFSRFLRPGSCIVAESDNKVVSAMYILPVQNVSIGRRKNYPAGYTYALGTLPAYRGRGIGSSVYKACCDRVRQASPLACVLPAEQSLYPFYESASGAGPLSYVREAVFTRDQLRACSSAQAVRFPAERYGAVRESLLAGLPHATFEEEYYDWMEAYGVEFFVLDNGLAAAEVIGDTCRIHELLVPDNDPTAAAAAVARWCSAGKYIVRTPVFFDGPGEIRPYVLASFGNEENIRIPDDLWWGFGFE